MKHGVPTTETPTLADRIYMRCMFHEYFYGPFDGEAEVIAAINTLDAADPYWDYDGFCLIMGLDPLPTDYVFGFPFLSETQKARIYAGRKR